MTPKEKARELVDNFIKNTKVYHEELGWIDDIDSAQQCALIAVDEIMKAIGWEEMELGVDRDNYWDEVKQEIKKL